MSGALPKPLMPGDIAPRFSANELNGNPRFGFDTIGGRYVLLLFSGSGTAEASAAAIELVAARRDIFDDVNASFFGVTSDPRDVASARISRQLPGIRWFLDYDKAVARLFGAEADGRYLPHWLLLDPTLRVVCHAGISGGERILRTLAELAAQPRGDEFAPVLVVPRVFEPELCRHLIELYDADGGRPSGFMREIDGRTTGVHDHKMKRRSDFHVGEHDPLRAEIRRRLKRFLLPSIERAFQFTATRIERYVVACYDGDGDGGYFRPHRDNTTPATAHRRFACSINLNADEFEGGDLRFPEYGLRTYRPPTGGAVIFSCSLLHEAMPVRRGKRYAYLPFFYDEAGAKIREANATSDKLTGNLANYRA